MHCEVSIAIPVSAERVWRVAAGAGSWTFKERNGETILTSRFTLREEGLPWWMPRWLYVKAVEWDTVRSFRRLRRLVLQEFR